MELKHAFQSPNERRVNSSYPWQNTAETLEMNSGKEGDEEGCGGGRKEICDVCVYTFDINNIKLCVKPHRRVWLFGNKPPSFPSSS